MRAFCVCALLALQGEHHGIAIFYNLTRRVPTACLVLGQPSSVLIGGLFPLTGRLAGGGVQREAAARVAVQARLPNFVLAHLYFDISFLTGYKQRALCSSRIDQP